MDSRVTLCAHCAEPVPGDAPMVTIDGQSRRVCCHGCAAAAQWIRDSGLDDYYRLRSNAAPRPVAARSATDDTDWTHPEVVAEHVQAVPGGLQIRLLTDAMRCAACAWLISHALQRVPGVFDANANAVSGRVRIAWDPVRVGLPEIVATLATLGFPMHLASGTATEARRRAQRRRNLLRIGVAGLGAMQAMMLSEAVYLDSRGEMSVATRDFFRWFTFLVSTPVVFFAGWPFLIGMARELRTRHFGMDTLVGSSILLAYLTSLIETLRGGPQVWFDAAVMFVFLLLSARYLEQWVRQRAADQLDVLERSRPALAWRVTSSGRERVAVRVLREGDEIALAPGDVAPVDGVALTPAHFDESTLTGEARPVDKRCGDIVFAGSLCQHNAVQLRVTAIGAQSYLGTLQRLIDRAAGQRPALARWADHIARRFVVGMLLIAIAVYGYWALHDPTRAFPIALSVLVISCPCALSLAIPAALAAAHAHLSQRGVLALGTDALARLAGIDTVVFDKTGTLTRGEPRLTRTETHSDISADDAVAIAAALQRGSAHPLALAFADSATRSRIATDIITLPGDGILGTVDGREWRLGRAGFAATADDDAGLWLGSEGRACARFAVDDELKDDADVAVAALQRQGLVVELLSGDAAAPVAAVATATGISRALSRQSPSSKLAHVRELQHRGQHVAMVGDGLNDAPVLAGADVSFAFARGAAIAQRHADFVIVSDALTRIPETVALARKTQHIVRQNMFWALAYNVVAIPFAAAGLVEPWLAALGMAASSIGVSLNALRLRTPLREMR